MSVCRSKHTQQNQPGDLLHQHGVGDHQGQHARAKDLRSVQMQQDNTLYYWLKLQQLISRNNVTPILNLISAFIAVSYLNDTVEGVLFPIAVVALVAGLVWQLIKPFVALATRPYLWA